MKNKEYFIWCDESVKKGKHYSNFYGGILIQNKDLNFVTQKLATVVSKIGITEEIKWQKVDAVKLPAFLKLMDVFFQLIKQNKIKIRIMFRQNAFLARNLEQHHIENEYFLLYYQFIKHAFGLHYSNHQHNSPIHLRLHFDYLPDTISKVEQFKEYIKGLERQKNFQDANLKIRKSDIVEVDSKKHLPIQFLDVVLGAIQFRLNDLHKEKPLGKKRRGKRTIAKEKLYKHINKKVRQIRGGFNIGTTTGTENLEERWTQPYRHWNFKPSDYDIDKTQFK